METIITAIVLVGLCLGASLLLWYEGRSFPRWQKIAYIVALYCCAVGIMWVYS